MNSEPIKFEKIGPDSYFAVDLRDFVVTLDSYDPRLSSSALFYGWHRIQGEEHNESQEPNEEALGMD